MPKGLDFDELYPGRFWKAGDFKGRDVTMTIAAVEKEELEGNKGKQVKGVVSFRGTPKQLCLNRTNGECLKAMFGRDTGEWVGKRVTFYPAKIESELADLAIRVRGSPDIAADVTFSLHLARKKPRDVTLKRTGAQPAGAPQQRAANGAARAPAPPPQQPETPPDDAPPPGPDEQPGQLDDVPGY